MDHLGHFGVFFGFLGAIFLAFTHRHGQSDSVHWPYLLCIRGRKTLSLVRFSGFYVGFAYFGCLLGLSILCGSFWGSGFGDADYEEDGLHCKYS